MSEGPWIRFFPSDWLAGTRGMTAAETGIYITLVAMMYERGGPIPNDVGRLARLCGTTTAALKSTLAVLIDERKITLEPEGLWNERVGVETEIRRDKSTSARKSAETRWGKEQEKQGQPDANAMRPHSARYANQNQSQNSTSSNEDVASRTKPTPRSELGKVLDADHAQAVIEHRQRKRAPLTAHAAKLLAGKFAKCDDPNAAADVMIAAGWQGFEPEWLEGRNLPRGQGPPMNGTGLTKHQREMHALQELDDEISQTPSDQRPIRRLSIAGTDG